VARPSKEGLEYIPVDVDIDGDDKLVVVIGKFGTLGFGIVIRLMMEVYKNGYFYSWTEREQYAFSNRINVDINSVMSVVSECIKWGFFNQKLYKEFNVLTSSGFQKRYSLATSRRTKADILPHLCLVENVVSVDSNPVIDGSIPTESTQSKVNKKKVNKTKKKIEYEPDSPPYKMAVYLHQKILEHAAESGVVHLIQRSNLQTWADDCRKLLEIDKVDKALIHAVINWSTSHHFWKKNILSASTLRNQFKKLAIEMSSSNKGGGRKNGEQGGSPSKDYSQFVNE
jgi:hypothetical protein